MCITERKNINDSDRLSFDATLTHKILQLDEYASAENILLFASTKGEVDTRALFLECIKRRKTVFFPKCLDGERMEFYRVCSKEDFVLGMYGIYEPTCTQKYISRGQNDLAVIPALCAGRDFSRLGYGRGYYDRFLKDFNGITVCPIYEKFLISSVPTNRFDIPLKVIITPTETIRR